MNVIGFESYTIQRDGTITNKKGRVMKHYLVEGLYKVNLTKDGKKGNHNLHRLIAQHFVPNDNPETNTCVTHLDGNTLNNDPDNLRWVSRAVVNANHRTYGTLKYVNGKHQVRFVVGKEIIFHEFQTLEAATNFRNNIATYVRNKKLAMVTVQEQNNTILAV